MSNGHRIEYVGEQLVKGRKHLYFQAAIAIVLGVIVLGHEIAVCVLQGQRQGHLSSEQLLATVAVFFTILAGFASIGPAKLTANPYTLRRQFIIAAILSIIATIFLGVALGLFVPFMWDYWYAANSYANTTTVERYTKTGLPNVVYVHQPTFMLDSDPAYTAKVVGILKFIAIMAESILIGATLLCAILSIINAMRRRGNYAPAPVAHETRVYYEKK